MPVAILVLLLFTLTGLAPGAARAAEPPLPAIREPHHRVALENAYVRTLEVRLAPGERTLYHIHRIPSVVVELSRATIISQVWGGPAAAARETVPGETRYAAYDEKPLLHQVTNAGSAPFHVMDIELLQPNVKPKDGNRFPPPLPAPAQLLFEKNQVRAYRLRLGPAERMTVPAVSAAHLLVASAGRLRESTDTGPVETILAGEEAFAPPGSDLTIANAGDDPAEAILLELETTGPVLHGRVLSGSGIADRAEVSFNEKAGVRRGPKRGAPPDSP